MTLWLRVRERLRALFLRSREEREMEQELAFHLEMEVEKNRRAGMGDAEARRRALIAFGGVEKAKEEVRDARGVRWLDELAMDLRFALRHFRRTPLSTATMVLVLVLGIGVNTALFAFVKSVMTLPAPGIERDEALVRIRGYARVTAPSATWPREMAYSEVLEYERQRELFAAVAAWSTSSVLLEPGDDAGGTVAARAIYATGNYFGVLGVRPVLGATLPPSAGEGDADEPLTAVIGHGLWTRMGGSEEVLGKTLRVNGLPVTVIGVAPPRFAGVDASTAELGLWLPLAARPLLEPTSATGGVPDSTHLSAIARLRPGIEARDAEATVRSIASRMPEERGLGRPASPEADVAPLLASNATRPTEGGNEPTEAALALVTLLILLVTCANVSALLIGLALARRREIAVRLSLGASRARIVRQMLTESVLLAVTAGLLGQGLLWGVTGALRARFPELQLAIDWPVTLFTFGFAIATGILFGLSPALHATRLAIVEVLKDSASTLTGSRSRLQKGAVLAQIALTQPLLVALGAFGLFLAAEMRGQPESTLDDRLLRVDFEVFSGNATLEQRLADMSRLRERVAAIPGVRGVVAQRPGHGVPLLEVHPDDRVPDSRYPGSFRGMTETAPSGYFGLRGIPVVRGRDFTAAESDDASSEAVIVGADLARDLWGPADPIGRRLRYAEGRPGERGLVVVGVVDEVAAGSSESSGRQRIYLPYIRLAHSLLVRTAGPAEALIPTILAVAAAEAPGVPISSARTLAEIDAESRGFMIQASGAAAAGGALALFLSAIGLYAVIAFAVRQREREIGIRTAMGARRAQVIRMFFASGLRLGLTGMLIGLPLSLVVLAVLTRQWGMPTTSIPALGALVVAVVVSVTSLATWLPARRAASVDPLIVLRSE